MLCFAHYGIKLYAIIIIELPAKIQNNIEKITSSIDFPVIAQAVFSGFLLYKILNISYKTEKIIEDIKGN